MSTVANAPACRNCGATLTGRFCAACGQQDRPLDPGVRDLLGEVGRELSSLDGRIVRSVWRLFLFPGYLTKEHAAGRRVAWVSPVRLYLTFSLAYFAIISLIGTSPLSVNIGVRGDTDGETIEVLRNIGFSSEEELRRAVNLALNTWMPRAMFVLVPVFAWLVSRLRRGAGRRYPHYLIFSLHIFAAFFGTQAIAAGAGHLSGHAAVKGGLAAASLVYVAVYVATALRAVYGGTLGRAAAHTVIALAIYWMAAVAVFMAIVMPTVFWR